MEKKLDLRIQKTYRLLHNAFLELLEEKSFDKITVNELCERAMIRRTTFYTHFTDKYQYYSFFIRELAEEITAQNTKNKNIQDLTEYMIENAHSFFSFVSSHRNLTKHITDTNMDPLLFQLLQEEFDEQLHYLLKELYPNNNELQNTLTASFFAGGLLNVCRWWANHPTAINEETLSKMICDFMSQYLIIYHDINILSSKNKENSYN
ncbi:MAG: TetR/AcrR family transcriptional regulator C-terminal domain-containing protein [Lachnospiraceae bacterium]|nr:TetR/AcrR family transcriptional regulator C-terminal domain-containing protein [Lachnospiraceae bacterium]